MEGTALLLLPFGISSASELIQHRIGRIIKGHPGVFCLINDVIISEASQSEYDERLDATLQ